MSSYSFIKKSQLEGTHRLDPEYYQSEYVNNEKIISSYDYKTLGEISEISYGTTPKGASFVDMGIPFVRSQNFNLLIVNKSELVYCDEKFHLENKKSAIRPEDILFAVVGSTIGQLAIVQDSIQEGNINQNIARVRITSKEINPLFAGLFFASRIGQLQISRLITGNAQSYLNTDQVKLFKIPFISKSKQSEISKYFDKIQDRIKFANSIYFQAENFLLEELGLKDFEVEDDLSYVVNLSNVKTANRTDAEYFKPKYNKLIDYLKDKFELKKIEELVTIQKGIEPGSKEYQEEGKPFIRVSNLSKFGIKDNNQKYLSDKLYQKLRKNYQPKVGEILLTKDASPGIAYVVKESIEGIISSGILRLKIKENLEPEYLSLLINSIVGQYQMEQDTGGSVIIHWRPDQIKNMYIPILSKSTQRKISNLVEESHEARKKAKQLLEEAKEKVESLIDEKPLDSIEKKPEIIIPFPTPSKSVSPKPPVKIKYKEYQMLDASINKLVQQLGDGSIIKRFEKTPLPKNKTDVICPHFLELKWATGCPYDCSWCYLKGTFRFLPYKAKPHIKDFDKIEKHTKTFLEYVQTPEVLNTGELADSLMFEGKNKSFVKFIVPLFENQSKHKVLFLTKSNKIKNLLLLNSHRQVIVSFSLNAIPVAQRWEKKAPSVEDRIKAAETLYKQGYEVRIRIDPMIPVENWKQLYTDLIDRIFNSFIPERITLGSLRGLQSTINGTSDKSWVKYLSERSNWGRKIDINLRLAMYKTIISYLNERYKYNKVALCKETLAIWDILNMDYKNIKCNCVW